MFFIRVSLRKYSCETINYFHLTLFCFNIKIYLGSFLVACNKLFILIKTKFKKTKQI